MAWFTLGAAIAHNYIEYRRGKPTICAVTRRVLPAPVSAVALGVGAGALIVHVWRGYVVPVIEEAD